MQSPLPDNPVQLPWGGDVLSVNYRKNGLRQTKISPQSQQADLSTGGERVSHLTIGNNSSNLTKAAYRPNL
jgi:hypothetical protein